MTSIHKQEILIKNVSTRSVTLFPSRAHVVRDINNIAIKEGSNEIEIYGLTPTADEHSVKVDGTGPATITDMTVDLVPNREMFEDAYPDESDEDESSDESDDDDRFDTPLVKKLREELKHLEKERQNVNEGISSAGKRFEVLDNYVKNITPEHASPLVLEDSLQVHQKQRRAIHAEGEALVKLLDELQKSITNKEKELHKASRSGLKEKERLLKTKAKAQAKKERQRAEKRKEQERIRQEREKFWPKKVFRIILHLETVGPDTPSSSRRSSVTSVQMTKTVSPTATSPSTVPERTISLALSYVTYDASWSPRYDINILTPSKSGSIVYRAEFFNKTSETWKDARISLSTSQTSYQGLEDAVPTMNPWHIALRKGLAGDDALMSYSEQQAKGRSNVKKGATANHQRKELFGVSNGAQHRQYQQALQNVEQQAPVAQSYQATASHYQQAPQFLQVQQAPGASSLVGGGLFGSVASNSHRGVAPPAPRMASPFGAAANRDRYEFEEAADDATTLAAHTAAIDFEESTFEDYGLTASYDVPGTRTLAPSSLMRRHKIATLSISNLILTSICVPKLRSAAFMRARFRNPSGSITLLKGTAGLSLDGSFLGNTDFPRVSPNELVTLPLGVDPALHVSYAKPTVHRSTQGIFNKEVAQIFTRNVWLTNTKPTPVELLVLDQVPISDDERLRVDVRVPRGLSKLGDSVNAGESARPLAGGEKWGKAVAALKKNGEVAWTVKLEKGQACVLGLEYETKAPTGEVITSQ